MQNNSALESTLVLAPLRSLAAFILRLEPLWLGLMLYHFWFPIEIRWHWLWLLGGVPLVFIARFIVHGRIFTRFPLDLLLLIFLALAVLNLYLSPFTYTNPLSRLYLLARPLLGILLCIAFVEQVRRQRKLDALLLATLALSLLIALLALTGSQWNNKSTQLLFFINLLPRFTIFPGAEGGFNANEIAGALAWITPLCAALAALRWDQTLSRPWLQRSLKWGFRLAFVLSFLALFLGQSRFALAGVLAALALLAFLLIPRWRGRLLAWALIAAVALLELLIMRNVFAPANQIVMEQRDTESMNIRFDIWNSAFDILRDYPWTGVGMNLFRDAKVRDLYPVPSFPQPILPHAHNEFLQIAADLGIPGLLVYTGWHIVLILVLWHLYRRATLHNLRLLAAGVVMALLAHGFYGFGDAITLWDRLAFVYWWMLALGCAAYTLHSLQKLQKIN